MLAFSKCKLIPLQRGELNRAVRAEPALLGTPALRRFASDATLCRYLRARKWNIKKAFKMLK